MANGLDLADLHEAVLRGQVFRKASHAARRMTWTAIYHRWLAVCPSWIAQSLVAASEAGVRSEQFTSLTYLYYALRDRLSYGFVVGPLWRKWKMRDPQVSPSAFLSYLDEQAATEPVIRKWREGSRRRLAGSNLSAFRDFGLLRGTRKKYIQRPLVHPETVFHLLVVLIAEGKHGRDILDAPDWRLFLWTESEVAAALADLAQRAWIKFERGGRAVILELIRQPGSEA